MMNSYGFRSKFKLFLSEWAERPSALEGLSGQVKLDRKPRCLNNGED